MRWRSAGGLAARAGTDTRDAGFGVLDDVFDRLVDHLGEGRGILAQLIARAGERVGDARAELRFEHRHGRPVVPARGGTGGRGCAGPPTAAAAAVHTRRGWGAAHVGAGRRMRMPSSTRSGDMLEARGTGAASEADEDGLGLVVEGVGEQDGFGPGILRGGEQGGAAGIAGSGFGPALGADSTRITRAASPRSSATAAARAATRSDPAAVRGR